MKTLMQQKDDLITKRNRLQERVSALSRRISEVNNEIVKRLLIKLRMRRKDR